MNPSDLVQRLPRLKDGTPAVPGMNVETQYLGQKWEAKITSVGTGSIDVQYTNAANHMAKGCVSRLNDPAKWAFSGSFADDDDTPKRI